MQRQTSFWIPVVTQERGAREEKDTLSSGSSSTDEYRSQEDLSHQLTGWLGDLKHNEPAMHRQAFQKLKSVASMVQDGRFSQAMESYERQNFNMTTSVEHLGKPIVIEVEEASKVFLAAKRAIKQGDLVHAQSLLAEAVQKNPQQNKYRISLSMLYIKRNMFPEALTELSIVVSIDPTNTDAYRMKGDCLHAGKKYQQALQCYKEGLKLKPSDEACLAGIKKSQLGIFNTATSEPPIAESKLSPLLQMIKSNPSAQINFSNEQLKELQFLVRTGNVKITE